MKYALLILLCIRFNSFAMCPQQALDRKRQSIDCCSLWDLAKSFGKTICLVPVYKTQEYSLAALVNSAQTFGLDKEKDKNLKRD